jgi:hypothetical protein
MSDFQVGENVFALVNDRTAVVECKIVSVTGWIGAEYIVESLGGHELSGRDRYKGDSSLFRSKPKAWAAVAAKWAAVRDVAELNRARAVDQSIA